MKKVLVPLVVLMSLALMAACASSTSSGGGPMAMTMLAPSASASTAQGMVHFQQLADGSVDVQADLTGVPAGTHGFHVHDKGDCGDNGNAAGGHYNPTNMPHGAPEASSHHAGDFGNVTADANGDVHAHFTTRAITVAAGPTSVAGHAVILHANADDLTTQPSGNAGARIACGVVTLHDMGGMTH